MKEITYTDQYFKNKQKYWSHVSGDKWNSWKWQLANRVQSQKELSRYMKNIDCETLKLVAKHYTFGVTPYFLSLIDTDDETDGLYRQIIPHFEELSKYDELNEDPFEEQNKIPVDGIIKRFRDRVIITVTGVCASYCRYCTRKWMWPKSVRITSKKISNIVDYLKRSPEIREVILSGGEPFLLPTSLLDKLLKSIFQIESIEAVRIGTRILSFMPQRINDKIEKVLSHYKPVWIMTHFNHPNEITPATDKAVTRLIRAGAVLCNQSVLLKGINDEIDVLNRLFRKLQVLRVKPYYLFQCDLVHGTRNFHVSLETGVALMNQLRNQSGGLCIPTYVIDMPGRGKIPVGNGTIRDEDAKFYYINAGDGEILQYPRL